MFHQCLLLLLFSTNLFIGSDADVVDPLITTCVTNDSDGYGDFTKIVSNDQCRQPFEAVFGIQKGKKFYIYTENTESPLDNSVIYYKFGNCELSLEAHNENGNVWFKVLRLGENASSGKRIDSLFTIHCVHEKGYFQSITLLSQDEDIKATEVCNPSSPWNEEMNFKQEVLVGEPNLALLLYKEGDKLKNEYFGKIEIKSGSTFGSTPAFPTTTIPTESQDISTTNNPSPSIPTSSDKSTGSVQSTSTQSDSTTLQSTEAPTEALTEDQQEEDEQSLIWLIVFVAIVSLAILIFSSLSFFSLNIRRKCCRKKGTASARAMTATQEASQDRMTY